MSQDAPLEERILANAPEATAAIAVDAMHMPPDKAGSSRLYAHYVLFVLLLANIFNMADRSIVGLLLEPIKKDLHATDTQMSLLTGASFVIFYSLFGVPIARWSDVGNRRNILAAGVALWSLMTAACGLATNFIQMALVRAGVGIGEAAGTPTSLSLIADYYARESRPQVISIFNLATVAGGLAMLPVIGIVTDTYGWRMAFYVLGLPGVAVALLVLLTVREPKRGVMDRDEATHKAPEDFMGAVRAMFSSRPFVLLLIGTAITGLGAGTLGGWGPAMMMRTFGLTATQVGTFSAPFIALAGIVGTLAGGLITPWLVKVRRSERWVILAPALVSLITIPAGVLYVWAPTWQWMVVGGMFGAGTIAFRTSPYLALTLDLVPSNCRGLAAASTIIATSVVGMAGGPLVVGMISDALTPSMGPVEALRLGFMFAPFTLAVGVIPFFMALRDFDANGVKAGQVAPA